MGRHMPHTECPYLAPLVREVQAFERRQTPPQTGPHKEEPLLYPSGTEPYDEPAEFTD